MSQYCKPGTVTPDGAGWHVTDHHTTTCPTQDPEGIALVAAIMNRNPL